MVGAVTSYPLLSTDRVKGVIRQGDQSIIRDMVHTKCNNYVFIILIHNLLDILDNVIIIIYFFSFLGLHGRNSTSLRMARFQIYRLDCTRDK